jgi:filamentous hemagglutinin family protein
VTKPNASTLPVPILNEPRLPARPARRMETRRMLLHSVSATALLASTGAALPSRAVAGSFRSINSAVASSAQATAASVANAASAQAAKQANLGAQNVQAAAARFMSLSQALSGLSYQGPAVPDGVAPGGLQQAPGVAGSNGTTLWSGASSVLGQSVSSGITDVTVTQTSPVASLTWKSFNIGARTKLIFNQSAGGAQANSWVAINTVDDPSANPTTILGEISAPGKVFILNANGILFGAGSQLNVGSLVASTASIAQAQLTQGSNGLVNGFSLYGTISGSTISSSLVDASTTGSVVVQPGASITTTTPSGTVGGGYVMLLADTVVNGGEITTPQGQTVLAAGTNFQIQPGYSLSNPTSTVIGSNIAVTNSQSGTALGTLGTATNNGIILSDQGDITMVGHAVVQNGVILAITTVDTRGTVHLLTDSRDATASVTLSPNSVTEILPEDNGETALDSQRAANLAASVTDNALRLTPGGAVLNDYDKLADTLGESRIEISTGGSVTLQGGAYALAQGGQVAVNAGGAIVLQSGSVVDVSGVNAVLPASENSLFIQGIVPYYLRDSAANRTGGLEFGNVYIDERTLVEITSGAYAGNIYTAGGLLEVSGNLGLVPHGIDEWASIAGQVTLQSASSVNGTTTGTVTVSSGSTINLTGGTETFQAGLLPQSYVQAADGEIYNINEAPGDLIYTGVYTGDAEAHPRWLITDTFNNPLLTPTELYQPAYTIGRDAGNLTIAAPSGTVDGTIDAGVTTGVNQVGARPTGITDPFLLAQTVAPLSGSLTDGIYEGGSQYGTLTGSLFQSNVLITGQGPVPPSILTALPDSATGTISVDGAALNADGFARVTFYTASGIAIAAPVSVASGGSVTFGGEIIEDAAGVTAHGGTITLTNFLPSSSGSFTGVATTPGSITVFAGATLDATGLWTNLARDPSNTSNEGYAFGGSISVLGDGPVDLQAGSTLDVSSGGVLSQTGKLTTAPAGNITVSADIVPQEVSSIDQFGAVTFDAAFRGYASGNGGTLSLTAPEFILGNGVGVLDNTVVVNPALLNSGFGDYVLNGVLGMFVTPGAQVTVTRPVYTLTDNTVPTGAPASAAYSIVLPDLFTQTPGKDSLTQRAGASLALESSVYPGVYDGGGGPVTVSAGASVTVDPGQSITLAGYGQVTDLGTLTAHGGTVTVANTRYEQPATSGTNGLATNFVANLSVWIGSDALVDVSGLATVMTDGQGRSFGQGQAGGTILLGGLGGLDAASPESTYAQVIVRPGAVLDAQAATATVDVVPSTEAGNPQVMSQPTSLSYAGGTISARSYDGVALDGTMLAAGAGPGAPGGSLNIRLDPQSLDQFYGLPAAYIEPEQILITQQMVLGQPEQDLQPGSAADPSTYGIGRISQQQIDAAGFDSVHLYAEDSIVFEGNVSISAGRSLTLEAPIVGDVANGANVTISAPYVALVGYSSAANGGLDSNGPATISLPDPTGSLTVDADLIDIGNEMVLGGSRVVSDIFIDGKSEGEVTARASGFANVTLNSAGDVRFDQDPAQGAGEITILASSGNIHFDAAQLYPTTLASAEVIAGEDTGVTQGLNELAGGTLSVTGHAGALPQAPFSVDGTLALIAGTVLQDGVVRAPEGVLELGLARSDNQTQLFTDTVTLGDGSVTSVSLYGQTVPFGGTVDGVNYLYNGAALTQAFAPTLAIAAAQVAVDPGATIDLRGGGTLSGAGFVAGRGGSADVNKTPLLDSASGTVAANTTDPVFAIVAGYKSDYAPVAPGDTGYDTPTPGEQITIAAGEVPGLAAGTYTLLPAYYDLLPGGYRVELTGAPMVAGTAINAGNFTIGAAITLGIANTGISGAIPTEALITSGAGVRQLSQYDEESYNQFAVSQAATFDSPRPLLPQDAKTLQIELNSPTGTIAANDQPFSIEPGSLLQAPASGGYGATLEITAQAPIEILAPGEATQFYSWLDGSGNLNFGDFGISGAMLSALAMPRLVLGGTLTADPTYANQVDVQGATPDVLVLTGATLSAGDIMLTSADYGIIHVENGATVSTVGEPSTAYGVAQGIYFNSDDAVGASPVVALSNGQDVFTPNANQANGASIAIDSGATLIASGSLDFNAPQGTAVEIGEALLQAQDVTVQVPDINIGSIAALAEFAGLLPSGLSLDAATLQTLAQNARTLTLTGDAAVNMIGSVALDSGKTDLVLYTPAIYGYGIAATDGTVLDAGAISITAPNFTWGGVSTQSTLQTGSLTVISAVPGGQLAGGVGSLTLTQAAGLTIAAGVIDLGYGPETQVDDQVVLNRSAVGFGSVTLQASTAITANNQSSLSVFASQAVFGQPGTGGDLTLVTPLVTAASGAVLDLTAGGALSANAGSASPAATGTIATLGATIGLTADAVSLNTAFALPSGKLTADAADSISLGSLSALDLSGRTVHLFDQSVVSAGGTLIMDVDATNAGGITQAVGGTINVSSPGANAGSIALTASGGAVELDGTLLGSTTGSTANAGSFAVFADSLASDSGTASAFDALNTALDAGGFFGARAFELAAGNITVDQTITAHTVTIAADGGNIDVIGTIDASGTTPGSIALSANGTLTLEASAVLDAHATTTQVDSYGEAIDAENAAHVTLTAQDSGAVAGSIVLMPGATINVSYPGSGSDPQGEVVINAPRVIGSGADSDSVAVSAPGSLHITGAEGIALYGFATYSPTDTLGTIVQDNGTGDTASSFSLTNASGTLGIVQIGLDSSLYMQSVAGNAGLGAQLAGLIDYGSVFHLRPGALIESTAASGGDLTISGDLDFSGLRFSDPSGFGLTVGSAAGSGEPGSVVFRASNDLTVNGSVSDGFLPPPDETSGTTLTADTNGWEYQQQGGVQGFGLGGEITNADLLLPAGAVGTINRKLGSSTQIVLLGETDGFGTDFDTTRPISLNYAIVINAAQTNPNVVIPFALTVGANSDTVIPAGGWIATAPVIRNGVVLFAKGQLMPGGFTFQTGDVLGSGTVLPVSVTTGIDSSGTGQTIPAGTNFDIFSSSTISLSQNTAVLQPNALIPSNTYAIFGGMVDGVAEPLTSLALRATQDIDGNQVQGYLYPLAQLLPAGSQSWSMNFVSGANLGAAELQGVQPLSTLNGSVFAPTADMTDAAPGSLLLDDQHYYKVNGGGDNISIAFSVIRTGTGDLSLVAGGDIDQSSLYGIYTAGTQVLLGGGNDAQFNSARQGAREGLLHGPENQAADALIEATYQAYYPGGGGDVLFAAQGNVTGDIFATTNNGQTGDGIPASDAVGNWLWRQGSTQLGQPTSWWINYGTLVDPLDAPEIPVEMVGFQGIGTLGGGNVTVDIGGNAGQMTDRDEEGSGAQGGETQRGEGLIIAVASTGRILPGTTTPVETGGGDIAVTIGGTLNPIDAAAYGIGATETTQSGESAAVNGDIIDTRGNISVTAGAIGRIDAVYDASSVLLSDPRALDPFTSEDGIPNGGIEVVPGDGSVSIATLRDLVIAGAADPGRVQLESYTDISGYGAALGSSGANGGDSGFTLWQPTTTIDLFSDGGNLAPTSVPNYTLAALTFANDAPTDYRSIYPANLFVTAATGDIIYGQYSVTPAEAVGTGQPGTNTVEYSLETMPAPNGEVSFLAGGSINANFYPVDISGASPAGLSLPASPAFQGFTQQESPTALNNFLNDAGTNPSPLALFALEADTPTTNLHADDTVPARFYAAGGDIIDFQTGETLSFLLTNGTNSTVSATWYLAAKPVWILASKDIVSSGTRPQTDPNETLFSQQENQVVLQQSGNTAEYSSGNLLLNNNAQSISVIQAGRDILSTFAYVGGPGLLDIQAGRNIYEASALNVAGTGQVLSFGAFKSLGDDLIAGSPIDLSGGANISILAGVGAGIDTTAFADLYFNPANQADLSIPLTDPANKGKVQQVYTAQLVTWLTENYGYTGGESGALAAFLALPAIDQDVFVRQAFFEELQASGAQESNPASKFYKSYARGRLAIDILLPSTGTETTPGDPVGYTGAITMYSGTVLQNGTNQTQSITDAAGTAAATFDGGVATLFGGSVQVIDPGGQATFGVPGGPAPGNNSGIVTYGSGDIDIYALDDVLLGKSRIFTTAGGNITIWSSAGSINAGIGAKTTQVYNPPVLVYDDVGDVTDTPPAISTGAGIATLQPLPDVPAGDVTLIAPLGTIDAGEAGIRVSGNLVVGALHFGNFGNVDSHGSTSGVPSVSVASLGAVEVAGATAGASTNAAQGRSQRNSDASEAASVLDVEVISIGGTYDAEKKRRQKL